MDNIYTVFMKFFHGYCSYCVCVEFMLRYWFITMDYNVAYVFIYGLCVKCLYLAINVDNVWVEALS